MVTKISSGRSNKKQSMVKFVCLQFGIYALTSEKAIASKVVALLTDRAFAYSDLPEFQTEEPVDPDGATEPKVRFQKLFGSC